MKQRNVVLRVTGLQHIPTSKFDVIYYEVIADGLMQSIVMFYQRNGISTSVDLLSTSYIPLTTDKHSN